ncbi:replicative DNA helicase [Asticcacaulis solisilvae]|uniref:replicative DNA helicase n=1 Tax=Asticcacaulis solisilvae TaxID=1217274 RepID=UPI003FD7AA79
MLASFGHVPRYAELPAFPLAPYTGAKEASVNAGQSFSILDAAQDVLGAILADGDAFPPFGWLKPHHFAEPVHQRIFSVAVDLNAKGQPVTLGGVRAALRGDEGLLDLDRTSKRNDYLASLWDASCPPGYAEEMASVLADDWARREAARIAHTATRMAIGDNARPSHEVVAYMLNAAEDLLRGTGGADSDIQPIGEMGDIVLDELEEAARTGQSRGLKCGLSCIDTAIGGFIAGDVIIVAGRPSMGKTGLARAMAQGFAIHNPDRQAAFFSLEMGPKEMTCRALSAITHDMGRGVPHRDMILGPLPAEALDAVRTARKLLPKNLALVDCPNLGLDDVRRRVWAMKRKGPLGLVVIDYLQLMHRGDVRNRNEASVIGDITKGLKQLARQAGCTIVLLSQLSREVEKRDDRRPQMSDLKDSGAIEQDADFVLLAFREAYYLQRQRCTQAQEMRLFEIEHLMEVIINKGRRTGAASAFLTYRAEFDHLMNREDA